MTQIKPRPTLVTILFLLVLTISGVYAIRFIFSIINWEFLKGFRFINPFYLVITGIFWGSVFFMLAVGIYARKKWAPLSLKIASICFILYLWIDRLIIWTNGVEFERIIFNLFSSIIFLIIIFLILNKYSVRIYFGDLNE